MNQPVQTYISRVVVQTYFAVETASTFYFVRVLGPGSLKWSYLIHIYELRIRRSKRSEIGLDFYEYAGKFPKLWEHVTSVQIAVTVPKLLGRRPVGFEFDMTSSSKAH
jgi:hypothetical protein